MNKQDLIRKIKQGETYVFGEKAFVDKRKIMDLIDQLDEPEKPLLSGKEELLYKIGELRDAPEEDTSRDFDNGFCQALDHIEGLLMTFDEPDKPKIPDMTKKEIMEKYGMTQEKWNELIERYKWHLEHEGYTVMGKPVIPDFVGKWIRHCKRVEADLFWAMTADDMDEKTSCWIEDCDLDVFARAWLDGYMVEEKKYAVKDKYNCFLLMKNFDGEVVYAYGKVVIKGKEQLTEQEIKDYDERYWPFAEEVK